MSREVLGKPVNLYLFFPHLAALKRHVKDVSKYFRDKIEEDLCKKDKELRDYCKARDSYQKHSK